MELATIERLESHVKPDAMEASLLPYEAAPTRLVRESVLRRLAASAWWITCLLPALVLLAVATTR
jgi:hypothetical protein